MIIIIKKIHITDQNVLQVHLAYFSVTQYEKLECSPKVPLPLEDLLIIGKLVLVCPTHYLLFSTENRWEPFSYTEHIKN